MQLIFRPEGEEPTNDDFRILGTNHSPPPFSLTFFTWDEVIKHLKEKAWPEGQQPWIKDGLTIFGPADIEAKLEG
jgi:hypothetical protein